MGKSDTVLNKIRAICMSLPETKETLTWGKPHFRVGDEIFAGYGDEDGRPSIGFKLQKQHAARIVKDPRFRPAPYVGHKGWVSMDVTEVKDWAELRGLILESFRLIAPKRTLATLEVDAEGPSARASKMRKKKSSGKAGSSRKR